MKRRIKLIILTAIFAIAIISCKKDNENPDDPSNPLPPLTEKDDVCSAMNNAKFKAYCLENFDTDKDGKLSIAEANAVTKIDVYMLGISSLNGIEYFANLQILYCGSNQLISLDVSKNTALTYLSCNGNQLTSLDVSNSVKSNQIQDGTNNT